MTIKPFAIQGADLTLGGVSLQAGTTGVVIPGVTQAANFYVEEVEDRDGNNPDIFGSDPDAIRLLDNAAYVFRSGAGVPSNGYSEAGYSVDELEDGEIKEINVEVDGLFSTADRDQAVRDFMWASTVSDAKTKPQFDTNDWTQIAFKPKLRAGEVEAIGGGGGADLGDFSIDGSTLEAETMTIKTNDGELNIESDSHVYVKSSGGTHQWSFANDGILSLPEGGDIRDSNGSSVLGGGGGADTGNVVFDGDQLYVGGTGFLDLKNNDNQVELGSNNTGSLILSVDEGTQRWEFDNDGGLTFPDGTTQTTAYTGQSGGSTSTLYVAVNNDGRAFTSTDGLSWTEHTTSMNGVGRVAVGPNMIVYTASADDVSNGDDDALWYASIDTPGTVTEVTGFTNFTLTQVKYFANIEKFVAIGNNNDNTPVILYSSNGIDWTQVDLDSEFLASLNGGSGYADNSEFTDIETNGTGFLLTTSDNNLGAFYTTDITTSMGQDARIDFSGFGLGYGFRRIAFASAGEYTGWHIMQNDSDNDDAWYYNNNTNPTSGTFSAFALDNIGGEFAAEVNYEPDVSEVVFGAYNGVTTIMIATNDGQILYWPAVSAGPWVSIPKPYTATDFDITQSNTATITFGNKSAITNEKIVLSNCTPSDYNGTYYVDNNNFLYTNADMGTAFDSSGLGSFESGTLTFSHGQYIDALHYSNGKFYAGNDDEEMFVSTDGGATWTITDTFTGSPGDPEYMNDIDSYVVTTTVINRLDYADEETGYNSEAVLTYDFKVDVDNAHLDINGDGSWEIGSENFDTMIYSAGPEEPTNIIVQANNRYWTFNDAGGLRFPDDTVQTTAFVNRNINVDGGGAAVHFEQEVGFVDGGFSATRHGVADPVFNGGNRLTEDNQFNLNGGGA